MDQFDQQLPHSFICWRHVNDTIYPSLYANADAVVLPTRGEAWCVGLLMEVVGLRRVVRAKHAQPLPLFEVPSCMPYQRAGQCSLPLWLRGHCQTGLAAH